MGKYKDSADYVAQAGAARDKMNVFPLRSPQGNEYGAGFDHAISRGLQPRPFLGASFHPFTVKPRPQSPHANEPGFDPQTWTSSLSPAPAPQKPNRTLPWQRGLVHGMMWRRRNPFT